MTNKIFLTQDKYTTVDDGDYEFLIQWKWHYNDNYARRNSTYKRSEKRTAIRMHRVIMNAPKGMEVDHINGDTLDNRRCNLRLATKVQNQRNRKKTSGTSKYKGVSWYQPYKKWRASIHSERWKHLGYFDSEQDAARAYNKAAKNMDNEFFSINAI